MVSLFRSRRPDAEAEEGGYGGKILRGRRRESPSHPYARPQTSTPPSPPALPTPHSSPLPGSPRWLFGLFSGASKLISSVFRSNDGSSASPELTSGDDSDGALGLCPEEEEDIHLPKELHKMTQGGKNPELPTDYIEGSQAIVPASESKLTIEKLLMQETFSRDECDRLIKIIQARVIESSSAEHSYDRAELEISNRDASGTIGSSRAWQSLNQNGKLPESAPYSPNKMTSFSLNSPLVGTLNLRSTAVLEAKKWLEEKRLSSNTKSDLVFGHCALNTDMLHHGIPEEVGSPVDLAKSYMRSLPPWHSPSLSSSDLRTPTSSKVLLYKGESTHGKTNQSLPSFKIFKRKYLSSKLSDSEDDSRRVRLRSTHNALEVLKSEEFDSPATLVENETLKISLTDDKDTKVLGANQDSSSLRAVETSSASAKSTADLRFIDNCVSDMLVSPDKKSVEVITSEVTDKVMPVAATSEPEQSVKTVEPTLENALPVSLLGLAHFSSETTHSKLESEPNLSLDLDNKDLIKPTETKVQDVIDSHQGLLASTSTSLEHGEVSLPEAKVVDSEGIKSIKQSDANCVTDPNNYVQASTAPSSPKVVGVSVANSFAEVNLNSDSKLEDMHSRLLNETNASVNESSANGSSAESNAKSDPVYGKDNPSCFQSSNGEPTSDFLEGTTELLSESAVEISPVHGMDSQSGKLQLEGTTELLSESAVEIPLVHGMDSQSGKLQLEGTTELLSENAVEIPPVHGMDSQSGKLQNGTRMRSIERMLTEPHPSTSRRGRRAIAKVKRGRRAKGPE